MQRIRDTGQKLVENVPIIGRQAAGRTLIADQLLQEWRLDELKFVDVPFEALKAADVEVRRFCEGHIQWLVFFLHLYWD